MSNKTSKFSIIPKNEKSKSKHSNTATYESTTFYERTGVKPSSKINPIDSYTVCGVDPRDKFPEAVVQHNSPNDKMLTDLMEDLVKKTVKSVVDKMFLHEQSNNIVLLSITSESHHKRIKLLEEHIENQNKILDILVEEKQYLTNLISDSSNEILKNVKEIVAQHSDKIEKLIETKNRQSTTLEERVEEIQESMDDIVQQLNDLTESVEGLKFKGNPPSKVSSILSSMFGKSKEPETKVVPIPQPVFYSSISFSVFPNVGYEKATNALLDIIREKCNLNHTYFKYETKKNIEEYESGEKVLFIRYCGNTRFESPDAISLLKKGCKVALVLFTYGSKKEDTNLSSELQNCQFIEIQIDGLCYHKTQNILGMDDEQKQDHLFQMIAHNFADGE